MSGRKPPHIPLPKAWNRHVRSAMLHVISLCQDAALGDEQLGQLLAAIPGLKRLTLRRLASVTDESIGVFKKLERLRELRLEETGVTDPAIE